MLKNYGDLKVWQKSYGLHLDHYRFLWFYLRIEDPGFSSRYRALPCNAWTIRGSASTPILYVCSDLRQSLDRLSDQMFERLASQTLYQGDMTLQGGAL